MAQFLRDEGIKQARFGLFRWFTNNDDDGRRAPLWATAVARNCYETAKQAKELGLMTKNSQRRSNPNEIPIA